MYEIICTHVTCTFRVHARYFQDKPRFTAGVCPVDNGPVSIVEARTDTVVPGLEFVTERHLGNYGAVVATT
jgi:hypothetical protein